MGLVLTPEYQLTGPWPLLLKSHLDDLVEATDELIRFWRSRGQGQSRHKVRCKKTFSWMALSITVKFKYIITYDAKMTYSRHKGHKAQGEG